MVLVHERSCGFYCICNRYLLYSESGSALNSHRDQDHCRILSPPDPKTELCNLWFHRTERPRFLLIYLQFTVITSATNASQTSKLRKRSTAAASSVSSSLASTQRHSEPSSERITWASSCLRAVKCSWSRAKTAAITTCCQQSIAAVSEVRRPPSHSTRNTRAFCAIPAQPEPWPTV